MHVPPVNGAFLHGYNRSPQDQALINQFNKLLLAFTKDPNDANATALQAFLNNSQNYSTFCALTYKLNGVDGLKTAWEGAQNLLNSGLWKEGSNQMSMLTGDLDQIQYTMTVQ